MKNLTSIVRKNKLKRLLKRLEKSKRLNWQSCNIRFDDLEKNGLVSASSDWKLSCPDLIRNDDILLLGSNTFDGKGVYISIKWRPQNSENLATLISKISLDLGQKDPSKLPSILDYEEIHSYNIGKPSEDGFYRSYSGKNISFYILSPYRTYRLAFRGMMRDRRTGEAVFVRLRLLILSNGKVFDFKEQFDVDFMHKQLEATSKSIRDAGILQDYHEHTVQMKGIYMIDNGNEERIFCWGFHGRRFEDCSSRHRKDIFGYFSNGTSFHIGALVGAEDKRVSEENAVESIEKRSYIQYGHGCLSNRLTCPLEDLRGINWEQVDNRTPGSQLKFDIKCKNMHLRVEQQVTSNESLFFDIMVNNKPGRGFILIDNSEANEESRLITKSISEYKEQLGLRQIINIDYLISDAENQIGCKPLVLALDDEGCKYSLLCGAKAASLAHMRNMGNRETRCTFKVPNGVVLTRFAYEAIQENNQFLFKHVDRLAKIMSSGDTTIKEAECAMMQQLFKTKDEIKIPQSLIDDLKSSLEKTSSLSNYFAVRSSSWGEDEEGMSAAGQLTTLLFVNGLDKLLEAILECYGSKYSYTNLEYKRYHGLSIDMPMAVVIQEMVDCEKAGVMFTCDPRNGDPRQLLITANYGVGESVVSSAADPDTILVNISADCSEVIGIKDIAIGKKEIILSGEEKTQQNTVGSPYDRSKCSLEEREIISLSSCGIALAKHFQSYRDIEWGYKDGQLYLFQSRPITSLDGFSQFELLHELDGGLEREKAFLTRANVGEVAPTALSPLGQTLFERYGSLVVTEFYHGIRTYPKSLWFHNKTSFTPMVSYYMFISMDANPIVPIHNESKPMTARAIEIGIFGHEIDDQELVDAASERRLPPNRWAKFFVLYRALPYILAPMKTLQRRQAIMNKLKKELIEGDKAGYKMMDFYKKIVWLVKTSYDEYAAHLMIMLLSPTCTKKVLKILSKYITDSSTDLLTAYSKLLASCPDVFSAGVPKGLESICECIFKNIEDVRDFSKLDNNEEAMGFLYSNANCSKQFKEFMQDFGHRGWIEFDVYSKPWRDDPTMLINMIRQSCQNKLSELGKDCATNVEQKSNESKVASSVEEAIGELGLEMKASDEKKLRSLVAKLQVMVGARERTKNLIIHIVDCFRIVYRQLAKEMCAQSRLPDEDLVFFLTFEELKRIIECAQPGLIAHAQLRRRLFKTIGGWKFDELIKSHDIKPLHLMNENDDAENERLRRMPKLTGTPASSGRTQGPIRIVSEYSELSRIKCGDILVTYSTDISYSPVFPLLAGIITEIGGLISHGAVIAREYGVPSVIGVQNATKMFKDGEQVILDSSRGEIIRLEME